MKLRVDLDGLHVALNSGMSEFRHYLDLQTGRVLRAGSVAWAREALLQQRHNTCEWKRSVSPDATHVAFDGQGRYLAIEPDDPYQDYGDMVSFATTVEDDDLQEQLQCAIYDRETSRSFTSVVACYPDVQEQWYAHKDARAERRLLRWLEDHGIERIA